MTIASGGGDIIFNDTLQAAHFYELVSGNFTWAQAEAGAAARILNGLNGYLVTIRSVEENIAVANAAAGSSVWIGGSDQAN